MTARTKIESLDEFNKQTSKTYDSKTNYSFEDIEFTFEINLETANIISFKNCLFKEKVTLPSTIQEDASFAESIFEKEAIFANSTFDNNVRFYSTKFYGTTDFNNTKFEYLADFWNAEFKHITIFYKTDFLGTTVFSSTKFNENVLFTYSLIEKLVIFRGTDFQKGIDLSLAIIPGKLTFFDIKFEIKNFKDVKDTEDVHEFGNNVSNTGVITRKNKRETFRIIKNQLNENQNSIDSLEFARYEKNAFTKQLEQSVYKDKNRKEIQNLILLYLNIISNKNGTSQWRGVIFTFGIGLFFFYISIIATENYEIGIKNLNLEDFTTSIKYFFSSMLPTHRIDYLDSEKPKAFFYLWDFLGRVFISFGIYQTIQAFRKYKNK